MEKLCENYLLKKQQLGRFLVKENRKVLKVAAVDSIGKLFRY